jgi:2-dehydro-3-deoxyphosphooctonate aldolase (KDO 8-P synthase)
MIIELNGIRIGGNNPFVLIAGPCVIENKEIVMTTASGIKQITSELNIPFIFKASYKKANRTSNNSFVGIGDEQALNILAEVKSKLNIPVITDIHTPAEAVLAAKYVDILQIPAFLCRQTELLKAAAATGKIINIKKGQFLAPGDMKYAAEKIISAGNNKVLLTERGSSFGYHNLVVDMRGLVIMKELGYPVVMDATHSVQIPGEGGVTGGQAHFIKPIARAAAAVGIDALFLEVHPEPAKAMSDAASQLPLNELKDMLIIIKRIDEAVKKPINL